MSRRYGDVTALKDLSFSVRRGEFLSFVGPSGAGKSTLLRILAGVEVPDSGSVRYEKAVNTAHPAILVFQDYLLFPHMTVFENVAFGLRSKRRRLGLTRWDIRERVDRYLMQLGIADKAAAWPSQLSGGQRQRVSLARALVLEPSLLLLDEPFANLDRNLKSSTARLIRDLQQRLAVTTVVVSHDLDETMAVSDRTGVLIDGVLRQLDTVQAVLERPEDEDVAALFSREALSGEPREDAV
jgi:putative spermidine/putrescine transport system ATP-binding protein